MVAEQFGRFVVGGVGDVVMADQGNFFRKCQDRAFFRCKEGGFTPGVESIDTLFAFAVFATGG